ncbi:MAG: dTDP-glucose 4,6-dehydratase [Candidatus Magnetoovum sp. WYHC-5]|nr:dTDP-glucose 4,6-dehydratase [Candidatus Magnetoovum sp. WYHC-5]
MKKILVTGGCGFIGSNFIRYVINNAQDYNIINLDALTYAGNLSNLKDIQTQNYKFIHGSIEDEDIVKAALADDVSTVVHFAAESHVDRSIGNAEAFLNTNIVGLEVLLRVSKSCGIQRFIHISTDEVYGSFETTEGLFKEGDILLPNSPYSASKAAADMLIHAYTKTYNFPAIIVRPSNNYGPYQYPEKFIPLMVTNLITNATVPLYGRGQNIRDWLFVEDNCRAVFTVMEEGRLGEIYNVGGGNEVKNLDLVHMVLNIMGKDSSYIKYVQDRLGHDFRYGLDCTKVHKELGWRPTVSFMEGLERTIAWYKENEWWWRQLKK